MVQFLLCPTALAQEAARLLRTDSRAGYVHKLTLYDRAGQAINPDDKAAKPYSPRVTCGKCHEYGIINHGWHFNAGLAEEPDGESGTGNGEQRKKSDEATKRPSDEGTIQNPNSKIQNPSAEGGPDVPPVSSNPQSAIRNPQSQPTLPPSGRPGEPWIFTDPDSGTQLPLSYREWPGTFRPASVGLTPWRFVQLFGRHLPGGGIFDPDAGALTKLAAADAHEAARWKISGGLEIDCMVCHAGAGSGYDAGEISRQVARENLAWIPTATLGLGVIRGDAKAVPDNFDPDEIMAPDQSGAKLPHVEYDKARFDADQRVFFDIVKDPPAERCYFCHSVREVSVGKREAGKLLPQPWEIDRDVHLAAGLRCSDCHSNGIDHRVNRGDSETTFPRDRSSCVGCHFNDSTAFEILERRADEWSYRVYGTPFAGTLALAARDPLINESLGGRFRAPLPQHAGLPPLHFDNIACTACHSGPWPTADAQRVQTAISHGLGVSTKERREDDAPAVFEPVFESVEYGPVDHGSKDGGRDKVGTNHLLWPAFWATRTDGKLSPLPVDAVQKAAKKVLQRAKKKADARGPLSDDEVVLLLKPLAAQFAKASAKEAESAGKVQVGYLRDGNFYTLAEGDKLQRETLAGERPYLWPLAHDVRPARQALGARGCTDCHAEGAPIFFGSLASTAQVPGTPLPVATMDQLIGYNPGLASVWANSFKLRSFFKLGAASAAILIALVLLRKTVLAGVRLVPATAAAVALPDTNGPKTAPVARNGRSVLMIFALLLVFVGLIGGAASSWHGIIAAYSGRIAGNELRLHMLIAPAFIAGLVFVALAWACSCSGRRGWFWNLTLGLGLLAGLVATVTIVATMSPLFGTEAQRTLLVVHRWSSLAALVAFPLNALCGILGRPR